MYWWRSYRVVNSVRPCSPSFVLLVVSFPVANFRAIRAVKGDVGVHTTLDGPDKLEN